MSAPPPSFHACRRVGGLSLRVEWDGPALAAAARTTLDYLGGEPTDAEAPALTIALSDRQPAPPVPADAVVVSETSEGLQALRHDGALLLRFRDSVVRVDPAAGTARGTITEPAGPLRDALVYSLTLYAAAALFDGQGVRTVHAACLARRGRGLLVVGESDSGKSTLTMRLVEAGWDYLSDDSVLLRAEADGVRAWPLRQDFCLDPEAEALFPRVAAHWEPHIGDARKRRFRIRELYPDGSAASCTLRAVVFPRVVDAATSETVPLGPRDTLLGLLRHTGAPTMATGAGGAAHLDTLRQLVGRAAGYDLRAGRDLRDDPDAADRLLRRVLTSTRRSPSPMP